MKTVFSLVFCCLALISTSQNIIGWDGNYKLQLSDFQSPATQIGQTSLYSIYNGAIIDFAYAMSSGEFMFTKNFNSKVNCCFHREMAYIIAPDSTTAMDLLSFARFGFDLSELYARKLRKRIYEEKGAFSDASFFKPLFEENQTELNARLSKASLETDLGRNKLKLTELHREVLIEIEQLSDFCKECKPPKKKKN